MLSFVQNSAFFGELFPKIVILEDATAAMTSYFGDLSTQLQGGYMAVIPAAMGLCATKFFWTMGKRFFMTLAR